MVTQTIRVNLNQKELETIQVVQNDTLREIAFVFYLTDSEDEEPLNPDGYTVKFNMLKPDNNFVMSTFTDGIIKLSFNMTAVTGTGYYCIMLMDGDDVIYSGNGKIVINDHVIGTENIDSVSEADGYVFPNDFYTKDTPLAVLDDTTTSTTSTWSSNKISTEISSIISDNSITHSETWSSDKIATELNGKPDVDDTAQNYADTWSSQKIYNEIQGTTHIVDNAISSNSTWSSNKINGEINTASTSAIAQLNAMKTGFDGVTYASPAAMVQGCDEKILAKSNYIADNLGFKIIDASTFTNTGYYLDQSGKLAANASFNTSDFIPVDNIDTIKIFTYGTQSAGKSIAFYTSNTESSFIMYSGATFNEETGIRTVSLKTRLNQRANYFRVSSREKTIYGFAYRDDVDGSKIADMSITGKSYNLQNSPIYYRNRKNLFNPNDINIGYYLANGEVRTNADYYYTNGIPVYKDTNYAISRSGSAFSPFCIAAYDSSGYYMYNLTISDGIVNTQKASTIKICGTIATISGLQFELGNSITAYEKYYETDAKKIVDSISGTDGWEKLFAEKLEADVYNGHVTKIKLLGDSITAGYGGSNFNAEESGGGDHIYGVFYSNITGTCWANSFKDYVETKFPSCTVKNYGCSGNWSADVVNHLSDLIQADDDVIILMIGTNNRSEDRFPRLYGDIETIIQYCSVRQKPLILMSCIPAENDGSLYKTMADVNNCITAVGKANGIPTINLYNAMNEYLIYTGTSLSSILGDGLHPNDTGYEIMFKLITRKLGFAV